MKYETYLTSSLSFNNMVADALFTHTSVSKAE